jgi:hypothetical protein
MLFCYLAKPTIAILIPFLLSLCECRMIFLFFLQIIMSQTENNISIGEYRFQPIEKKFESIDGKQNRDHLIKW